MFPTELTRRAFRASNGELAWNREDVRFAISILAQQQQAILGGELWWVPEGARDWTGLIPQRHGPDAVYPWSSERMAGEDWPTFVKRSADESLQAIERWPGLDDLPINLQGRVLCNLTWVSERDYGNIRAGAV
jgi:hypothetical protein